MAGGISPLLHLYEKTLERLLAHVERGANGCWVWVGDTANGYGVAWIGNRKFVAPRVFYELFNGAGTAEGLEVCHKCDNPACVNPEHLFIGDHAENMADAKNKKRMQKGEARPTSKLTEEDVVLIRKQATLMSMREQGRRFGVSHEIIRRVIHKTGWTHVGG